MCFALITTIVQVVEVNPFKHLVHLSLNMSSATDAVVKTYLAGENVLVSALRKFELGLVYLASHRY